MTGAGIGVPLFLRTLDAPSPDPSRAGTSDEESEGVQAFPVETNQTETSSPATNSTESTEPESALTSSSQEPGQSESTTFDVPGSATDTLTSAASEPASPDIVDHEVIDSEVSQVTAEPGIAAEQQPGKPTVLKPAPGEEAPAEVSPQGAVPTAAAPVSSEKPPESPDSTAPTDAAVPGATADPEESNLSQGLAEGATDLAAEAETGVAEAEEESTTTADAGGEAAADAAEPAAEAGGPGTEAGIPGVIPPPQPEALRAQIPQRELTQEEFLDVFVADRSPAEDQALLAGMMDELRAQAEQEKEAILAEAETQKEQIMAAAQEQAEAISATAAASIESITSSFAAARESLTAGVESSKAALTAQIAAQVGQIESDSAAKVAAADEQLTNRQTSINDTATTQSQQPQALAEQEAARAESALEAAAVECEAAGDNEAARYPGSDEANPDKRSAAHEVADRSAADIREKKAPLAEDIRSRAGESSGKYFEYAASVCAQIDQARADLIPGLTQFGTDATASLQESETGVSSSLDERLTTDLAALDAAEQAAIAQVESAESAAVAQINQQADQACVDIDSQAATMVENIDVSLQETESVVLGGDDAYVPGMRDVIEATRASITAAGSEGRAALAESATTAIDGLTNFASEFSGQMDTIASGATEVADGVQAGAESANAALLEGQAQQGEQTIGSVATEQESVTSEALVEVDGAIAKAEADMASLTDQFASDLKEGVDESIDQAILPRTDDVETRTHEAAAQVDDAWYEGLFRALGQIVIGLVIMVVVALIIAAIAAAFGVILTAWTAVMIAGAILLAVGLIMAIISRSQQPELADAPWYEIAGIAVLDTVGYTGIHESISGRDFVTDRTLSAGERTERGVMGAVTLISLVLGARSAIKGPPGGAFTRPNTLPRGFVGWGEALPQAWRGVSSVGIEMWQGTRQGASSVVDWVRSKFSGAEPGLPGDPLAPAGGSGETGPVDSTTPADTVPADNVPADNVPADNVPADTVPADTVPADTVPADTVPADTVPQDTPAQAAAREQLRQILQEKYGLSESRAAAEAARTSDPEGVLAIERGRPGAQRPTREVSSGLREEYEEPASQRGTDDHPTAPDELPEEGLFDDPDSITLDSGEQLNRPALREETMASIEDNAPRNEHGEFVDPDENVIHEPDYGHKPGYENRRILAAAKELNLTQAELNEYVNSRAEFFQIEEHSVNISHANEMPGIEPFDHIVADMESFFGR